MLLLCVFTGLTSFALPYFVAEAMGAGLQTLALASPATLGAAVAAMAWSLGTGGVAGFRTGVVAMVVVNLGGCLTLVLARTPRRTTG